GCGEFMPSGKAHVHYLGGVGAGVRARSHLVSSGDVRGAGVEQLREIDLTADRRRTGRQAGDGGRSGAGADGEAGEVLVGGVSDQVALAVEPLDQRGAERGVAYRQRASRLDELRIGPKRAEGDRAWRHIGGGVPDLGTDEGGHGGFSKKRIDWPGI